MVQRHVDEGPGPEVPLAILQEGPRCPQGWCSWPLPSLSSRSLIMKGVAGPPPTDAIGGGLLQWLRAVQFWAVGRWAIHLSLCCQGMQGWGRKRRTDVTLGHWWSPGSHTP